MRTGKELREALDAIYQAQYEDPIPNEFWFRMIRRISEMSNLGSNYVHGISAALYWALGEEWEFVETPGMIEAFRDYRSL